MRAAVGNGVLQWSIVVLGGITVTGSWSLWLSSSDVRPNVFTTSIYNLSRATSGVLSGNPHGPFLVFSEQLLKNCFM